MVKRIGFDDTETAETNIVHKGAIFVFQSFLDIFQRAFRLGGRTSLPIFWVQIIILVATMSIIWALPVNELSGTFVKVLIIANLACVYLIFSIIVRRTHDIGEGAWSSLNIFHGIWLIFQYIKLFAYPGDPGSNKYGPDFEFKSNDKRRDPKRIG